MGQRQQTTGTSDQFDDIIENPEIAEGPDLSQKEQGYSDDTPSPEEVLAAEGKTEADPEIETFENMGKNTQTKQLEEKEDVDGGSKKEDDKTKDDAKTEEGKKEESKDGDKDEGKEGAKGTKEEEEEGKVETAETGKTLKLFQDGKRFEVPSDATIKVKIDGKNEKVTVAELRDSYSGRVAYDKKFSEITEKNKELTSKEADLTRVQTSIKETLGNVKETLATSIKEGGNPMDAVDKIVDLLGVDSYDFKKALFDSQLEELIALDRMDEFEQEAHWLQKRNDHLTKRHESLENLQTTSKAQEDRIREVDNLREANGVSEDDFVSAFEQLSQLGQDVDPKKVVQYAVNLPFVTQSEEILKPYEDQLSDDEFDGMVAKIANTMKLDKSITKEDMVTWLAENYEVEDIVKTANGKAVKLGAGEDNSQAKPKVPSQRDIYANASHESFDDF